MRGTALAALIGVAIIAVHPASAQEGPLKTGLDGTFAPHAMPTLGGGVEGFNVDLANEIARRLGREIEITATQFSGLLPGLQAGTYDFIVAPTTVTAERAKNLLFVEGYLNTDFQFVVKADAADIDALEDFEGKTIAVNKGSAYDRWARDLAGEVGWTVESYGTNTDAVQAVLAGRADAAVAGNTVMAWAAKKNPQVKLSFLHSTGRVFSMPFRKDDEEMRNKVEEVVECMKLDGTLSEMSEKWFGVTPAGDSAARTVFFGYGVPGVEGYDPTPHVPDCG
ncbi:transporter substrate-binding domain-containing protein [Kaustia mangrovi]|uniref:Transporter substrate-binding domain-containing protein n=1 Tax=Kaustia mangrovi TaxID=2593653 RepID=A0A7S8HCM1_9HYPH|nr:transporter substrate-binding domain-containing protein [Kaustia mangrovi]QPC43589.1 transporter substrate-binding domain-containing protein [Kaustia mangrovi]